MDRPQLVEAVMLHYRLDGHEPVLMKTDTAEEVIEWARWYETAERQVMSTKLIDGSVISTFFLGLDHQWGHGPPLLFETALFSGEKHFDPVLRREVSDSSVVARYSTWAQAEAGHMEWIERCVPPDMIARTNQKTLEPYPSSAQASASAPGLDLGTLFSTNPFHVAPSDASAADEPAKVSSGGGGDFAGAGASGSFESSSDSGVGSGGSDGGSGGSGDSSSSSSSSGD
jgi:hypothetical protein